MKILKLVSYHYPEQVSSSHLVNDLYEAFEKNGIETELFAPSPTRGISEETREKYKKIKYEEAYNGSLKVHRFPMFREGKNPALRAIRYVLVNIIEYFKGIHCADVDLIFSGSTPPTQGLLCGKVAQKLSKKYGHKVPFVYNLQDIFPDSLVNAKMTTKGSVVWKIGRKIEDYTYKNADKIITISDDFKANIMAKGVPEEKIVVIPNWVNKENVYPVDRKNNILFDRYGLDRNLFYICYSGNIGHSQNMDLLLDVAAYIKEELPDVRFVLIGDGAAKEKVEQRVKAEAIDNVIMLPFQDYSEIAYVFSLGDVGLIISKPGIGGSSVPSKTYSIMAAERPILASFDQISELAKVVFQANSGIVVQPDKVEEFVKAICTLKADSGYEARNLGSNGLKYMNSAGSKEKCVDEYINVLERIVSEV